MLRFAALIYGLAAAIVATAAMLYLLGFVGLGVLPSDWLKKEVVQPIPASTPNATEDDTTEDDTTEDDATEDESMPAGGNPSLEPGTEEVEVAPDASAQPTERIRTEPTLLAQLIYTPVDDHGGGEADRAAMIDLALIFGVCLIHVLMSRNGVKKLWTWAIPAPIQRSTCVLLTSAAAGVLFWQWRPIQETIWGDPLAPNAGLLLGTRIAFGVGAALILLAGLSRHGFNTLGLRHVLCFFKGRQYTPPGLDGPILYRLVRNPMWLGLLLVVWASPWMTLGHALFAVALTAYMPVAIFWKERNLIAQYGQDFRDYQRRTPAIIPLTRWGGGK